MSEFLPAARPIPDLLREAAAHYGSCPAIDFMGRVWLYRDLAALVDRAARGLQGLGVVVGVPRWQLS